MRDARSSYFDDGVYSRAFAPPPKRTPSKRSGFAPLNWLRSTLFGSLDGTTIVPASSSPPLLESRGQLLREAHRSLRALIKQHPGLRQVMPHLAYIERALARKGSRALMRVPVAVLQRGLEQLERLQAEQPRDALRTLRTRLVEAIALRSVARDSAVTRGTAHARLPAALEVMEASHSDFDEAERSWKGTLPYAQHDWADPPSRH
ncbi:MAG: hypothetical protein HY855_18230 [Burkholderiales bacterium]|nr:hypothetical protein [Burkholderiales bacterium]